MLSLSPHQLNVFLVAAETLNFTHAAQRLEMTQPSVSQHIQALEEHFRVPLFIRTGRSIELTDAGVALIPLAREVVYLAIHLEETMASLEGKVHGHLMVGCSTSTGRYILPKLLARFHQQYPHVRATCLVVSKVQALQLLEEGKVHLVLASQPPYCQDVEFCKIASEEIILCVHPQHPWARQGEIELKNLKDASFILPEAGSEIHSIVGEALAKAGVSIDSLTPLISLGSLEAVAFSIQEGLGVGFVPCLLVERLVQGRVKPVRLRGLEIVMDVYAGRNTRRPATAAQNAFWDLVLHTSDSLFPALQTRQAAG